MDLRISRKGSNVSGFETVFGHRSIYPDSIHIFRPEYSQTEKNT
jgi:hypothetical protein